ncbi:ABC transporter substrate-binding protein [Gordonia iterans]|uniref:ABC transporter substrate-binding protein n=1 Tax=Gordonia iterans TaxID=1004901 RepID=A0A2S0KI05_9ACTN|nr:ABC transporter family substrate-binding protein [Gordonia iterans]AVM01315.1 ABC transporter substrate-binding protein [Gordonia iterans]
MVRNRLRRRLAAVLVAGAVATTTGCMADPPPPVRETLPTPTPNEYPDERTVYLATDPIGAGFNPHLGADQSTVTTAIAAMTLPSAFVPERTPEGEVWRPNPALVESAEVTSTEPFTVTYRLVDDAQWSDGLPVTGDDFTYLWQQMSRQPNVVGHAGYRAITNVQTSGGGKVVTVAFESEYHAWRELFTNLLPSHKLRSDPTGFQTGMDRGKPVTAGPFAIYSIDRARDEVRLIRNDRYWRTPPLLDQVVLRRAGTAPQMAQTVRNGDSGIVALTSGQATAAEVSAIPGVRSNRSAATRALSVNLNTRAEVMKSLPVRQALLAMLDADVITAAAAGGDVVTRFANTVYMPSDDDYFPVDRARPSQAQIQNWLTSAGFTRGTARERPAPSSAAPSSQAPSSSETPAPSTSEVKGVPELPYGVAPLLKDGAPLVVRVGATNTDQRTMSAAENIADQLRGQGVRAVVRGMTNTELYGQALSGPDVDLVVGWDSAGIDPATALASQVGCQAPPEGTESGAHTVEPEADPAVDHSVLPTPTGTAGRTAPEESEASDKPSPDTSYIGNTSGLCDPTLIALAARALTEEDPKATLTEAEPLLAAQAVYLPLYQDTVFVAVTEKVTGVPLSGPIQVGIFGDAAQWDQS